MTRSLRKYKEKRIDLKEGRKRASKGELARRAETRMRSWRMRARCPRSEGRGAAPSNLETTFRRTDRVICEAKNLSLRVIWKNTG